jgi:plastocyanin
VIRFSVVVAAAAIVLAACSGSTATSAPTAAPATSAPTAAPATAAPATAAPATAAPPTAAPAGGSGSSAATASIKNFAFDPANIPIAAGGTVVWTNNDSTAHTVTFDDSSIKSSGNLNGGVKFSATFPAAGTFTYHCSIHPSMKGTVTVS